MYVLLCVFNIYISIFRDLLTFKSYFRNVRHKFSMYFFLVFVLWWLMCRRRSNYILIYLKTGIGKNLSSWRPNAHRAQLNCFPLLSLDVCVSNKMTQSLPNDDYNNNLIIHNNSRCYWYLHVCTVHSAPTYDRATESYAISAQHYIFQVFSVITLVGSNWFLHR